MSTETVTSLALGVGLAAATGLRIFLPATIAAIAARAGGLQFSDGFGWLAGDLALGILVVAALCEVAAWLMPWLDNLLDAIALPAASAAGALLAASVLVEVDPAVRWTLAAIAGGGTAGLVHTASAAGRAASTATTGGLANPGFTLVETGLAAVAAVLAILVPVALVVVAVVSLVVGARRLRRRRRVNGPPAPPGEAG